MTDIAKILTSVLSGGTQQGGGGGLLGQIAGMAQGQRGGAGGGLLGQIGEVLQQAQGRGQPSAGVPGQTGFPQPGVPSVPATPGAPGGNLLDQLMTSLRTAQGQGGAGGMFGQAAEVLQKHAGGFGGGAAVGTLAGLLLGTGAGRKIAGTAVQVGGLAAIGGLAYVALRNYQQGKPVVQGTINDVTSLLGMGQAPQGYAEAGGTIQDTAEILLRSMVAAAYSDGEMSPDERAMIVGQLETMGLGQAEKSFLDGALAAPVSMKIIAASCTTDEMKAQAYIAAHLGMEVDTAAEAQFLRDFAAALGLEPSLVAHLDQAAAEAKAARA
ncbi:tellurite resistance TerB family protein [Phreatobacter oligotrophus]|uniref:tellurite resistance TerB family protein n=1 Tax=Phreatobacter oligotrophus TaxID=1122261 RepID=UPI0023556460|nr:tellurite resistance TerB family protein [Phreatobacter oligotrophus]MBX9990775.1 tellurite resistance TerB family protein [Phreatobacter oligotrophus]